MKILPLVILAVLSATFTSCTNSSSSKDATVLVTTKHRPTPTPYPGTTAIATYHGIASWYSIKTNNGTKTASGRKLRDNAYSAAHKTLPFGSKVRVTSLYNGKSEVLTITDRGPYVKGRIIDVTIGCAKRMGWYGRGVTKVKVELLKHGTWKYKH